jgi:hypothetical protein
MGLANARADVEFDTLIDLPVKLRPQGIQKPFTNYKYLDDGVCFICMASVAMMFYVITGLIAQRVEPTKNLSLLVEINSKKLLYPASLQKIASFISRNAARTPTDETLTLRSEARFPSVSTQRRSHRPLQARIQ